MKWWNVLESSITCESGWRFRLNSALPWPGGGNEFTWHNRNIKKCREDLGKLYVHFNFLSPFRRLFVLSVTSLFYESDHEWEDQPGWGDEETQKNDEEQVSRTDLASKDSVLHTVEIIPGNNDVECITYCFLPFSCNYNSSYIQMYAAMFGWAMYQMMESNKTQIVWAKEEKLAS